MAVEAFGHMMAAMDAAGEVFLPTMIRDYLDSHEKVEGAVMVQMTCRALLAGQAFMSVGGYIVRGIVKSCGRRATAIRRPDGAFEMVLVEYYAVAGREPAVQRQPLPLEDRKPAAQPQPLPLDDLASAASSICLAIQSHVPAGRLLPAYEAQATLEESIDVSELPYQEKRDLFEAIVQQQQQQQQQQTAIQQQLQFDNDMAAQKLASYGMGERPLRPTENDHNHDHNHDHNDNNTTTIYKLQSEVSQLKDLLRQCMASMQNGPSTAATQGTTTNTMHANIATPSQDEKDNSVALDPLQGPGDPYRPALGHEDLGTKIRKWAVQVLETGVWPRPQILPGSITDVTGIVQLEVDKIRKEKQHSDNIGDNNDDKFKDVLSTIQQVAVGNDANTNAQNSPISMSSNDITNNSDISDIGQQILANIGLGTGGDGDGGGDDSGDGDNEAACQDTATRINGSKRNEFNLVNPRNITITQFSGRNLNTTPYIPFNNSIRRLTLAQGSDGELLLKILDGVEALGHTTLTNSDLHIMITRYPKIKEFDTAIKSALLNCTIGTANSIIKHSVNNWLDA